MEIERRNNGIQYEDTFKEIKSYTNCEKMTDIAENGKYNKLNSRDI